MARVREPSVSGEGSDEQAAVSDPHEIGLFEPRQGRQWGEAEVDREVRHLAKAFENGDKEAAVRGWGIGQRLRELYFGFAERAKGHRSFLTWSATTFDTTEDTIYQYLRIYRRLPSEEDARGLGRSIVLLGFQLLDLEGIDTFETLRTRTWTLPDGEEVGFPATRRKLARVLKMLATERDPSVPRRLTQEISHRNEMLKVACANDPQLEGLRAKYEAIDGEPRLRAGPLSDAQLLTLAKLVAKMGR